MKKLLILLAICVILIYEFGFSGREIHHGPGELTPDDPVQENISQPQPFQFKGYTITPLANFDMTARVLSRENYYMGRETDLSPVDFAMGWGAMSDSSVLDKIDISQSGRWYHWQVQEFPIPRREIEIHSANMHMIPADDGVKYTLSEVHRGDVITLHGKLIRADSSDGWHWQSSMTREDTGDGACEVIYVESLEIKN